MNVIFVLLGITVTSFISEFFCINPGGLIVPVFLTTYLTTPEAIIGTFFISTLSFLLFFNINKLFIIQKKHRFIIIIIISSALVFIWRRYFPHYFPQDILFETVGWIIPGIFSFTMTKNGFLKTSFFTILTLLFLFPFYLIFRLLFSTF